VFLDFIVKEAFRALLDYEVEVEFWSGGELMYTLGSGLLFLTTIIVLLYACDMVLFSKEMLRVIVF
jgi:hypothetical protein